MKKHLLLAFALAMGFGAKAQTYIPVTVSGYTADVVAEGSGSAATSTNQDVDGVSYNFVAQNFVNPSGVSPTSALPNNGVINSATSAGLPFQLAPYSGNNSLRISSTGTGTLTFGTPRAADQVYVLATSGSGTSTVTITVTFTDATTQVFSAQTISDWYGGTNYAIQGISRVNRTTNVIENSAVDPRLYQYLLTISAANVNKPIQSIAFNKTSTTGVLNVMGVTIKASIPPSPNDAGITAINAPGSPTNPGNQNIQVTLKNFGTSALTGAQINWKVGSTVGTPYTFSGNLAPGATVSSPITIGSFNFPTGTHTIKTWTSSPNGLTDGNNYNDTLSISVISCNTLSGTFTIDKSSPASATSFPSFAAALQSLTSCGVSGPVIFNVAAGTGPYNEQVVLPAIIGTSATNTITFNGNGNTLVNPTTSGDALKLNGSKYLRFNNLKIEAASGATAGTVVALVSAAENNIFTGCTFTHSITTASTSQAVYVYSGSSNNTFQNNIIIGAYYGIYNYGASATLNNNNQFIGNTIKDPYYYGIYNYYSPGSLIEGNDISRPNRTNSSTLYGIYNSTGGTGVTISKNRIHNTHDAATSLTGTVYGIYAGVAGTSGSENIVKNNAIYNVNNTSGYVYAIYNTGGNNTYYYHNTVAIDAATASYNTLRGMYFLSASTNVKFNNNNISLSSNATTKHAIYLGSSTIALESKNNNLYVGTSGNVGYHTANKATLADWKSTNNNAYDQASVSVDPQYLGLATGNLKPANVGMNDIGLPVTPTVADDITGAVRSTTTPDPGAYEFSVSTTDVGVIAVTGPVSGCGLTANQTITVTIKNFGSITQSNIPVNFSVNGTIIGTGTFAGPLAPNATGTLTFTTTANLSAPGPYAIVGSTLMTGDTDVNNNSFTLNVTNALIPTLPVSLNFETPATGIGAIQMVTKSKSALTEGTGASFGTGTKGMIMEGIDDPNWITPVGVNNPWTTNLNNFSAAYMCITPAGGAATDSLWLSFDLKQLFKTAAANTNFRVTVNGVQVGNTYNPPFSGTPITWKKVKVDLTAYKNDPTVQVGLESNVKEGYANGSGTANLIDNVMISRRLITGLKPEVFATLVSVFPNPSNGQFNVSLQTGKAFELEVTDITGKVVLKQSVKDNSALLNLGNAAKGIYILKVTSESNTATKKLIIE